MTIQMRELDPSGERHILTGSWQAQVQIDALWFEQRDQRVAPVNGDVEMSHSSKPSGSTQSTL